MDPITGLMSFAMLVAGIFLIALSSIALECYNKHSEYKDNKKTNFNFIIFNLLCGLAIVLSSFSGFYAAYYS